MKHYVKLMRVSHYLKSILIFFPIFFGGRLFEPGSLIKAAISFLCFSIMSSVTYIINDIKDVEKDRKHQRKKERPIASGKISVKNAWRFAAVLFVCSVGGQLALAVFLSNYLSVAILLLYFLINFLYSYAGFKNIPLLDLFLLVAGYYLRVLIGSVITGIEISSWLYLVVIAGSLFMVIGKRRNELRDYHESTRTVLSGYNYQFLNSTMYVSMGITIVFFSLWCMDKGADAIGIHYTVLTPFIFVIFYKYCMNLEHEKNDGDPMNVILHDKVLLSLLFLFGICFFAILYL